MCTHSHRAVGLEHGHAHDADHQAWTRRDFLVRSGLAAAGASVLYGASAEAAAARALGSPGLMGGLRSLGTDRVLVLLQLQGGNDGLNTVVPVRNDLYYAARPSLALSAADTLRLDDDYGLHPALAPVHDMWRDGHVGIVHSVGYENRSLSHFEGADVWASASETPEGPGRETGWSASAAAAVRGDVAVPPSVQIGTSYPLMMTGPDGQDGVTLPNPQVFDQIVVSGELHDTTRLPDTGYGRRASFVRSVANNANQYLGRMQEAARGVANAAEYPTDYQSGNLGRSLAAVARLIKGRLGTRVYLVRLGSFDTHSGQQGRHEALLRTLGASVSAFYRDLAASGDAERTLTMTFSEFGRRVAENGSAGTDHGTAAPLFLFGPSVAGGFSGTGPDLAGVDAEGNLPHSTDFRNVYSTVLGSWLGLDAAVTGSILGDAYAPLDLLGVPPAEASTATPTAPAPALDLSVPAPNPVRTRATVRYRLADPGPAEVALYDTSGRQVATLASGSHDAGAHVAELDAHGLAAGLYMLRLQAGAETRTQTLSVVR
ncbi:DUF1501 domain-containing protein [Rubrivirga sp.]|uniref:DUF1501 domain-containing protein n=1 Tax=Rubrivirga sp. TaxID=1885344 RepID=UPI003B51C3C7